MRSRNNRFKRYTASIQLRKDTAKEKREHPQLTHDQAMTIAEQHEAILRKSRQLHNYAMKHDKLYRKKILKMKGDKN